jgi:prolyl-tRNA synthetase
VRWTNIFIPTLRDEPAEFSSAAHRLLIRAGYMRKQDYLFLGRRTLRKMVAIVRHELDRAGAQEIQVSSDKAVAAIASEIRSPKQLPQIWYQFQNFNVKCYAFGSEPDRAEPAQILTRCGIKFETGADAFFFPTPDGRDPVARGTAYAATLELAKSVAAAPSIPDPAGDLSPEPFHTPGKKTIADVAQFTGLPETSQMKSLVMIADQRPLLILLRGDHQLSETKLRRHLNAFDLRPAQPEEIFRLFGANPGSLGPIGVQNIAILADESLRNRRNLICGANRDDYHLRNVAPGEDFEADFADMRQIASGEIGEDDSPIHVEPARVLTRFEPTRWEMPLDELLLAAVDQHRDPDGLTLAPSIAPFTVVITTIPNDETQQLIARDLYASLQSQSIDVLCDDRDERAGVKFKDADLIGIPYRINVGRKAAQGMVEIVERRSRTTSEISASEAPAFLIPKCI